MRYRRGWLCAATIIAAILMAAMGVGTPPLEAASKAVKRPNILLISVDTLRSDVVGVYGNKEPLTPHIDGLARGGVVATNYFTQSSWTRASFGSLFTSLNPSQHQAERNMQAGTNKGLSPGAVTMAEILKESGYKTAAFQSNGNASEAYGFSRGFDTWLGSGLIDKNLPYAPADRTYEAFAKWWGNLKEGQASAAPFFAWVNLMDTHMPYSPKPNSAKGIVDSNYKGPVSNPFSNYRLGRTGKLTAQDKDYIRSLYKAQVRYVDEYVGKLLKLLDDAGVVDDTIIVLTSDHGEEFWDHGRQGMEGLEGEHDWGFGHGHTLFDDQIKVPFIVSWPPQLGKKGKVTTITQRIRQIDFLPTILQLASIKAHTSSKFRGISVVQLLSGHSADYKEPDVFAESVLYGSELKAIRTSQYKLVLDTGTSKVMLIDLADDPSETKDVAARMPKRTKLLKDRLLAWVKEVGGDPKGKDVAQAAGDSSAEEVMKKLGY